MRGWIKSSFCIVATTSLTLSLTAQAKHHSLGYQRVLPYFEVKPNLRNGSFRVEDEDGQPVGGAQVLIGAAQDIPFNGNFLNADALGRVAIPNQWTTAQSVTLDAPGYVRTTYSSVLPINLLSLTMSRTRLSTPVAIGGTATQFGTLPNDGNMYVALVTSGLTRADIFDFDPSALVSPVHDQINLWGKNVKVPSNLAIPNQHHAYQGLIPLTFDKPDYRFLLFQNGKRHMIATRARFPFDKVVAELKNKKKLYDLFGYFEFLGAGTRDVVVNNQDINQNVPVDEIEFKSRVSLARPPSVASDALVFAVTLPQVSAPQRVETYMPSDLKRLDPQGPTAMTVPNQNGSGLAMAILKPKDPTLIANANFSVSDALKNFEASIALKPFSDNRDFEFLPLFAPPQVKGSQVTVRPPVLTSKQIAPLATYMSLTELKQFQDHNSTFMVQNKRWQFFASDWQAGQEIPQWPGEPPRTGTFRWEVYYLGCDANIVAPSIGPQMFYQATHVVRNAVQL